MIILFLFVIVKKFIVTKSSVMEIQNLVGNPKSEPVERWTIPIFIQVLLQQKSMTKFFKLTKKTYFVVIFCAKVHQHLDVKDTE